MLTDIPKLDAAGLRRFGLTTAAILCALFGLALPWLLHLRFPAWPWWVGGVLALWALLAPRTLGPVYRGWMTFGLVMGAIMNRIVLGLVFFLLITPLGAILRLAGRDPMARNFDPKLASYRVASHARPESSMEKPF